tara:strand:+ start:225 stop:515 length:291 start_codon:yes stop_codon:yes gene_type:complete
MTHRAIYDLYDNVIKVNGDGDDMVAYDKDDKVVAWDKDDVSAKEIAIEKEIGHIEKRRSNYPPIGDQLDALWKGGDDQAAMKVLVDKVKSDFPKGG